MFEPWFIRYGNVRQGPTSLVIRIWGQHPPQRGQCMKCPCLLARLNGDSIVIDAKRIPFDGISLGTFHVNRQPLRMRLSGQPFFPNGLTFVPFVINGPMPIAIPVGTCCAILCPIGGSWRRNDRARYRVGRRLNATRQDSHQQNEMAQQS